MLTNNFEILNKIVYFSLTESPRRVVKNWYHNSTTITSPSTYHFDFMVKLVATGYNQIPKTRGSEEERRNVRKALAHSCWSTSTVNWRRERGSSNRQVNSIPDSTPKLERYWKVSGGGQTVEFHLVISIGHNQLWKQIYVEDNESHVSLCWRRVFPNMERGG